MSRVQTIVVVSALALFVYAGATGVDTWVGDPAGTTPIVIGLVNIPAAIALYLLLFGGLPLAVFGLLLERQWTGVPMERRRYLRVPYAAFMFQIVSTLLSGFLVVTLGPIFLWSLNEIPMDTRDWFMPSFLLVQTLAGIAAIPVWRRLVRNASDSRSSSLSLTPASRV